MQVDLAITVDAPVCGDAVPPAFIDGVWHDLPEGWLDMALSAIRYSSPERTKANNPVVMKHDMYIHLFRSKMYATNREHLIEYKIGKCSLGDAALLASEIKLLKSFGNAPSAACIVGDRLCFRFDSGEKYETQQATFPNRYAKTLKDYWKFTKETSKDVNNWKSRFLDQLGYLRDTDCIAVNPDGFVGQQSGNSIEVHIAAETGCPTQRRFGARTLYDAVAIADGIDFTQEHACYKHPVGRGIFTSRSVR